MKLLLQKIFVILFLFISHASGICVNVSICSWNLKDLGNSKSDAEIRYIAGILKNYDINVIQEVVAISGGTQA